ncbi:hypothetical protein Godav_005713 [Gossypium davidsonii]|uniref:Uncharacterized protein n=1 Tax=Gossypium davidsonii TaxID=34287 RepID=A0A7J8S1X0_GOSDV|nr:hypothetical protein [Gossypium davidsonii]
MEGEYWHIILKTSRMNEMKNLHDY